jgi:hypothetical protein
MQSSFVAIATKPSGVTAEDAPDLAAEHIAELRAELATVREERDRALWLLRGPDGGSI